MKAQIIAAGVLPRHQAFFDASYDFLLAELQRLHVDVQNPVLADADEARLFSAVEDATRSCELILLLTPPQPEAMEAVNAVVSKGLGLPLELREADLGRLRDHAAKTGAALTEGQLRAFASAPRGALHLGGGGLVQGYALAAQRQLLMVLPLSPSELVQLFQGGIGELLRRQAAQAAGEVRMEPADGQSREAVAVLKAVGIGDTPIPDMLQKIPRSLDLRVGYTQDRGDWTIRLAARGASQAEAGALCQRGVRAARDALGAYCYSDREETLSQVLAREMEAARLRVTLADGCCAGMPEELLAQAPGADKVAAVVAAYSNKVKVQRLGVSQKLLGQHGAISRQAAVAMAVGAKKLGGTQLGAAIVGNPGPGADEDKPIGLVYVAITDGKEVWVKTLNLQGQGADRDTIRSIACLQAFHMLRLYTNHYPGVLPGGMALGAGGRIVPQRQGDHDGKENTFMAMFSKPRRRATAGGPPVSSARSSAARGRAPAKKTGKNLFQKIKSGEMDKSDWLRLSVVLLCLAIFIVCVVYIVSVKMESVNYAKWAENMAGNYYGQWVNRDDVEGYPADYQDKFAGLWMMNEDVAGWINIPDTIVDYVVVQGQDNTYYERRDFSQASNQHGVPFVDYRVDQHKPSTNTVIYGHNMDDGQIFGPLLGYKSLAYYQQHPLINYDTVYEDGAYKIFGVVLCKKNDPTFNYHNFIDKDNLKDTGFTGMTDYINKIRERSLINTKVDVKESDHILTLSTCDYSFKSSEGDRIARLVIFARKVRQGEDKTVDTAGATLNTSPVMPQEWYAALAKKQEAELKAQQEAEQKKLLEQWLTENERTSLSDAEKQTVAAQRKADAAVYLTYDEQQTDVDTMAALIRARKEDFQKWLTSSERESGSLSDRLDLIAERKAEARAILTQDEIAGATSWRQIQELMEQKQGQPSQALTEYVNSNQPWLEADDITSDATTSTLRALVTKRKERAAAAGLSDRDARSYSNWQSLLAEIVRREGAAQTPTLDELKAYIAKTQNRKWLMPSDAQTGMTTAELDAIKEQRTALAASEIRTLAGYATVIPGSSPSRTYAQELQSQVDQASTWEVIREAIDTVKAAESATRQASGPQQQINELFQSSDGKQFLGEGDRQAGVYTAEELARLKALITQRKEKARQLGITLSDFPTWSVLSAEIKRLEETPSSPSSSSPSSSTSESSGDGGEESGEGNAAKGSGDQGSSSDKT